VARILIVGGGCRGRHLAGELLKDGNAVRITTRAETGRAEIEAVGAECWVGTPDRLATLRGALDGVTVLCWLLGSAGGTGEQLEALFTTRLEYLLTQAIDTTVRGFVYEQGGSVPADLLVRGREIVAALTTRNQIPVAFLTEDPAREPQWRAEARRAVAGLLGTG
jgi:hypothetical protein